MYAIRSYYEPVYDIETLINAAKIILDKTKKVQFLIIGEGPQKNELIGLTKNLGISDNVSRNNFV